MYFFENEILFAAFKFPPLFRIVDDTFALAQSNIGVYSLIFCLIRLILPAFYFTTEFENEICPFIPSYFGFET